MTRHELKEQLQHDQFTDAVSNAVGYATSHRDQLIRWVAIAVGALVLVGAGFWYSQYRNGQRDQDLSNAFAVAGRPVGQAAPGTTSFPTEDAKNQAVMKAFSDVMSKDSGSAQALTAQYYLGTLKAKKGDMRGAEADLSHVADSSANVAPLAKIALAQIYQGDNRTSQAQALLQSIVDKPTALVSKAQAQILLARLEAKTNPQAARKLLQNVSADNKDPVVARVAQQVSSDISK